MTTPWSADISLIIPHATEPHVMLMPAENGWTLPRFTLEKKYTHLYLLQRAIREELDADMTVLRWIAETIDEDEHKTYNLWLMENHTLDWSPPEQAQWIDRATLDRLTIADSWMREPLQAALESLVAPVPENRPPWYRPGWFAQARAWTFQELTRLGYTLASPPEQFKQFSISALLRAETTSGNIFFKVANSLPLFGHEPKLLEALGKMFPKQIPVPIAMDEPRRWMLCTDFGEQVSGSGLSQELLERIMTEYARLQISTATLLDTLFEAGCLNRRLDILAGQIDNLLADEACYAELNSEERAAWQSSGAQLKALCEKLAAFKVPHTLVHGDFHGGNVAYRDNQFLFFDWTDACIAHPFFDLPVFMEFTGREMDEAGKDSLRDTYLACWTDYEPVERLRQAYEIAIILAALHQAVSYQHILNAMEPHHRQDWDWGVPYFARSILAKLRA